jgi:peptidoglycan/xylan/chitin deacetylase (PgdA/CDA1 family)
MNEACRANHRRGSARITGRLSASAAAGRVPRTIVGVLTTALMVAGLLAIGALPAGAATGTIITLTFDDSNADQLPAAQYMAGKGINGTFFMNSGFVDHPGYLGLADVQTIQSEGNEIASHTISHADLTAVSIDEATRQICDDRVNWANWGIPVANFAYPFADANSAVESAVADCGDNSGRGLGDVRTRFSCQNCVVGETVPPPDKYYTRAPDEVDTDWTLADLEKSVTQAEARNNGKWVELTFHHICTGDATTCPSPSVTPTIFDQFVDWLSTQRAKGAITIKTVGQVIGGTTKAAVAGPVAPEAAPGVNAVQDPSMETFDAATGLPEGYLAGGYGTNTAVFSTTTNAHTGSSAVQIAMSNYSSGDAKLVPSLDLGQYAPTVTPGETWNLGEWYESTAVTQFALYYRTADGLWNYWTSSPWFAASSSWTQATWQTPAIPAGATALSFGLNIFANGTLTVDDMSMVRGSSTGTASTGTASTGTASAAQPDTAAAQATPDTKGQSGTVAPKQKGAQVTTIDTVPGPQHPQQAQAGKRAEDGVAPGAVSLQPFVVAPELTRG